MGPVSRAMGEKERVRIMINGEKHHLGVIDIKENSVIINVSSTPQQAEIKIGESKKFELNNDTFYDIEATLNSIDSVKN